MRGFCMATPKFNPQGYASVLRNQSIHSRGVAWGADLYLHGRKIGDSENRGDGGQTRVRIADQADQVAYDCAAVRACPQSREPQSRFAELLQDHADGVL